MRSPKPLLRLARPVSRTAFVPAGTGEKTASKEPILAEREHNICGGPALSFYTAGASLGAPLTFWTNALDHAAALQRFKRRLGPHGDLIQKKVTVGTPLTWLPTVAPGRRPKYCVSPRRRPAAVRRTNASGSPQQPPQGRGDPNRGPAGLTHPSRRRGAHTT